MTKTVPFFLDTRARIGRFAGIALAALVSVVLAGCYDMTAKVAFKSDGRAHVDVDLSFPPEAKDIIAFYDSIMQLQPETAAMFGGGICKSVELIAAINPSGPLEVRSEQKTTPESVSCKVSAPLGKSTEAADKLLMFFGAAPQGADRTNVIAIDPVGDRRLRISIDFNRGMDPAEMMRTTMLAMSAASGKPPNEAGIQQVVDSYAPFVIAVGKLMGEKRGFTFVLDGVKVIETNGEKAGDKVTFRWGWAEFMQRVNKAEGIENKVYHAVIEY